MGPVGGAQDPNVQGGQFDDIQQALAMMMEQQQQGGPQRPPTAAEDAQLRQKAMEMVQQKKAAGGMNPGAPSPGAASGAPTPPPPGQPPMGGPPQGPANIPPATGQGSANEALDQLLMAAKAQTPQAQDVKPPMNFEAQKQDTLGSIDKTLAAGKEAESDRQLMEMMKRIHSDNPKNTLNGLGSSGAPQAPGPSWGAFGPQNTPPINIPSLTGAGVDFDKPMLSIPTSSERPAAPARDAQQTPSQPPSSQQPMSDDELMATMKRIHSDNPQNTLPNNGLPQPSGPMSDEENAQYQKMAEQAQGVGDKVAASGVDDMDKAKIWLNNNAPQYKSLMDDPEYKALLSKYETEYENAKQRTDSAKPTVGQYIGAALLGLAGVHPQVIQNYLHGDQANLQNRESLAGEQLMKAQMYGLADKQQAYRQNTVQQKMDEQQKIQDMKEKGLNERQDKQLQQQRDREDRHSNMSMILQLLRNRGQTYSQKEKANIDNQLKPLIQIENMHRQGLNKQPVTAEQIDAFRRSVDIPGGAQQAQPPAQNGMTPQGMAPQGQPQQPNQGMQQSALRLIGLGA